MGAESGRTVADGRGLDAAGTCAASTFLSLQLAGASGNHGTLEGVMGSLSAVGENTLDIQPDCVIIRFHIKDSVV